MNYQRLCHFILTASKEKDSLYVSTLLERYLEQKFENYQMYYIYKIQLNLVMTSWKGLNILRHYKQVLS